MQISKASKRLLPALVGKARELTGPLVRELEDLQKPGEVAASPATSNQSAATESARSSTAAPTLTGWSTKDLMAAVREIIASGRAVARGRFLNLRV